VVFRRALVEKATAAQPATHALLDARGDGGDVGTCGRGAGAEHDAPVVRAGEDAISPPVSSQDFVEATRV
jgi:hypothetical protein